MAEHSHIVLEKGQAVPFKAIRPGKPKLKPVLDPLLHSQIIREKYSSAVNSALETQKNAIKEGLKPAPGVYVDILMDKTSLPPSWSQLDTKTGVKLMNVKTRDGEKNTPATIFIPEDKKEWLNKKLNDYSQPEEGGKRKSSALIDVINDVKETTLASFFLDKTDYDKVTESQSEYEIWIPTEINIEEIRLKISSLNIVVGNGVVTFDALNVLLIKAKKSQLERLIQVVKPLSQIRRYCSATVLTKATYTENNQWNTLIGNDATRAEGTLAKIGILDTGVKWDHPLIKPYLDRNNCVTVKESSLGIKDVKNHGTPTAGIVLYGDLRQLIYSPSTYRVTKELVSVKMYHDEGTSETENEHKAIITKNAIEESKKLDAEIMISSVTSEDSLTSRPSANSAYLDKCIYNSGDNNLLFMLSAGNRRFQEGIEYPNFIENDVIQDPAQAWNALTVGAMTDYVSIEDKSLSGARIVAPAGGPSPTTTTSVLWGAPELIKPEIVMEGGNAFWNGEGKYSFVDDLDIVSTSSDYPIRSFTYLNATSAAVAMAANLAGDIKYRNPGLSGLTIRALIVHSAEWTESMIKLYTDANGVLNKDKLMHVCGYGTPNRQKAITSTDSYVTFVCEDTIKPFELKSNEPSFAHMNIYELPWPKETLLDLGDKIVKMKITLSYYIEPSPGEKEVLSKYSYASTSLRFDVNRSEESIEQFRVRVSHVEEDGIETITNDTNRWEIGIQRRNQGSIHSDFIKKTAAELASCNYIAVFPTSGWWKSRKTKKDAIIKYTLVVSLETPDVDIYTPITQNITQKINNEIDIIQ